MRLDPGKKILVIGLGLIGGSYAAALSAAGYTVGGIDPDEAALSFALEKGYIKEGRSAPSAEFVGEYALLIFALYPGVFVEWIRAHGQKLRHGAILTDVTGVKCGVIDTVSALLRADLEFIPAHPMAGREVGGVQNARADLFVGANLIITPTAKNTPAGIAVCRAIGEVLGFARIELLSPQKHDEMIGFLSQLTHCIAVSLMTCRDTARLVAYSGDSFRDLTRIAQINDRMWSELFLLNKEELLAQMSLFEAQLARLKKTIENDDREGLREMMRLSTMRRKEFDKPTGGT